MPIKLDDVCCIIVTFSRTRLLHECIQAIVKGEAIPNKIFVIDNSEAACQAETSKMLSAIDNPQNVLIEQIGLTKNIGGAGGFAHGIKMAQETGQYNYVWLMDDDVEASTKTLSSLYNRIDPETIVVPYRQYKDGQSAEYAGILYNFSNPFLIRSKRKTVCLEYPDPKSFEEINITAFAFEGPLIPMNIISTIGLPNAQFFIFGDDTDFALRAHQHGFNKVLLSKARLFRKIPKAPITESLGSWKGKYIIRNNFILDRLHGKNWAVRNLRPVIITCIFSIYFCIKMDWSALKNTITSLRDAISKSKNFL